MFNSSLEIRMPRIEGDYVPVVLHRFVHSTIVRSGAWMTVDELETEFSDLSVESRS